MSERFITVWRKVVQLFKPSKPVEIDERPAHVIDAERHPDQYFSCSGCGSGPWHISWWPESRNKRLGGCCSGAD